MTQGGVHYTENMETTLTALEPGALSRPRPAAEAPPAAAGHSLSPLDAGQLSRPAAPTSAASRFGAVRQ